MKPSKMQFAGLLLITGISVITAAGCRKTSVNPEQNVRKTSDTIAISRTNIAKSYSGDEDGPKFPPHWRRDSTSVCDSTAGGATTNSGDEDGPKFPPHGGHPRPGAAANGNSGDEDGPKFPPHGGHLKSGAVVKADSGDEDGPKFPPHH